MFPNDCRSIGHNNISELHVDKIRPPSSLTQFEKLCMGNIPVPHSISVLYKMLQMGGHDGKPLYIREWARDLQLVFSDTQLEHIYWLTHASSVDTKMQESSFKLFTPSYRVPAVLARIDPTLSDLCWRDCGQRGSFLHVWWEYPKLHLFWQDVRSQIKSILVIEVPDCPLNFLLHEPSIPISCYRKCVLPHLLNAPNFNILEKIPDSKSYWLD